MKQVLCGVILFVSFAIAVAGQLEDGNRALQEERYGDAYRLLLPEAKKGDAFAQYNIAFLLSEGLGVKKNEGEAAQWYEKAAAQGDTDAQTNLGSMYRDGTGVERDLQKAHMLFDAASRSGNAIAQNNLGAMYFSGNGVKQNHEEAVMWFSLAADKGVSEAQNSLAVMYLEGKGVPQDTQLGSKWLQKAAAQGFGPAQTNLFNLTLNMASNGNLEAMHNVGAYYLQGFGVTVDAKEGIKWLTASANGGQKESARVLFQIYERGAYGVQSDEKKALYWRQRYEN